ncbi:amidase [Zavarzinia sp. CC-PAN008]|uniref:amidase n=1 Tax=Zavarzinia sp. CC-PAN008 TaxID=3243332 RepID=UPI003F743257
MPISAPDTAFLSAAALSQAIATRRLSPVDVVDAALARIERLEPRLHAFVAVHGPIARLAAEAADKALRAGHAAGPLHGIPIALKDLIDLEGHVTTGGSAARRGHVASATATLARRLLAQGMIVLGKTHTVEFAMGGWGTNQHMGTPWNPWDMNVHRVPGGSSSGSGVAVAAGLVPWAVGTDTGGSVRLPASFCGLTGLKTTIGRISTHGVLPLAWSFDTPGPMARSVQDVALLYEVLRGPDPLDPLTHGLPPDEPGARLHRGVRGLRLGAMPEAERAGCDPAVLAAYDAALDTFANLGAEVVPMRLPFQFADLLALNTIVPAEAYAAHGAMAEDPALPLDENVRGNILAGATISAVDYLRTRQRLGAMKQALLTAMDDVDALLTPTTEVPAIPVAKVDPARLPSRFTRFANMLELCALAVPDGFTAAGLPCSLQIVCRGYAEATALRIGQAFQSATDWHLRHPDL